MPHKIYNLYVDGHLKSHLLQRNNKIKHIYFILLPGTINNKN